MQLRSPISGSADIPLSTYVREGLLADDLRIEPSAIMAAHQALLETQRDTAIPYHVRKQGGQGPSSLRGKETDAAADRKVVFTDNSPAVWLHYRLLLGGRSPE